MSELKVLSEKDIKELINFDIVVKAVESAYKQKSNLNADVWPLVFYEYEHNVFDLDIRSGNLKESNVYGLKLISYNENNPQNGLPKVNATALICDDKTGGPLAILNAEPITSYRTGIGAAIGAKYLAKKDSKNMLVVGCGNIAKYSVAACLHLIPTIENIYVYNARRNIDFEELSRFEAEVNSLLNRKAKPVNYYSVQDIKSVTQNSDIIITATPAENAMIDSAWVKKGTHFSCMGAGMSGKQEIDEKIFADARIFADDEKQCLECGEAQTAFNKGIINKFDGEIGDVLLGKVAGRLSDDDITIFDSTGLFIQDLATSIELINESNAKNIGTTIDL